MASQPASTLEKLAAIGFKHVELPMFPDLEMLQDISNDIGISLSGLHIPLAYGNQQWDVYKNKGMDIPATTDFNRLLEQVVKCGISTVTVPYLFDFERSDSDWPLIVSEHLNNLGEQAQHAGVQLCYHNHHYEFVAQGNGVPFDTLIAHTDAQLVKLELDVYWLAMAGLDPVSMLHKHASRLQALHIKDLKNHIAGFETLDAGALTSAVVPLGSGILDLQGIHQAAAAIPHLYKYIELEGPYFNNLASLEKSLRYMESL